MNTELRQNYESVMPTYARFDVCFTRGEGCHLYDTEGRRYVDFASGIGVNSVGYAHPDWVAAVSAQAAQLAHASNLYYTEPGGRLAARLARLAGLQNVFFSNSGAEANEALCKLARKYSADKYGDARRHVIVTLTNSFHGRTHTTLAATGQEVFHKHFQPLTPGFVHVPAHDLDALRALGDEVCAVLIEPVQGEGGVLPLEKPYAAALQALCAERDWLLLCDEVQTGLGRCGQWFGFQTLGLAPDAVSFAKGIAGGLPLGGVIASAKLAGVLTAGLHATTFGANPVCCAAALATLDILEQALPEVAAKGAYITDKIKAMRLPQVRSLRGVGLMLGVQLDGAPRPVAEALLANGLVALTAGRDVLRFLPPLTIGYEDIDEGLAILQKTLTAPDAERGSET